MEAETLKTKSLGLIPLRNFGIIKPRLIYRSAQPLYNYEWRWIAKVLNIRTVINLRAESDRDSSFCNFFGMEYVHIPVKDKHEPNLEDCDYFMDTLKSCEKPVLIHCEHGHGRTSTFSVLARIAEGWSIEAAIREEEEKFHYNFKHPCQKDFLIKNFSK